MPSYTLPFAFTCRVYFWLVCGGCPSLQYKALFAALHSSDQLRGLSRLGRFTAPPAHGGQRADVPAPRDPAVPVNDVAGAVLTGRAARARTWRCAPCSTPCRTAHR
ncbi:hypothetical protein [Kibdelosporangium philippinense]|uniref:hypothetical protein n=1 Tax=Kibdelosporangium philippinense TaxID=211113 RepID=UPI00361C54D8